MDLIDDFEPWFFDGCNNAYKSPKVSIYYKDSITIVILFGYIVFNSIEATLAYLTHPLIKLNVSHCCDTP
jgi:hypothetical protein